MVDAHDSAIF